jgi:predicted PurR-regulated permease PerM
MLGRYTTGPRPVADDSRDPPGSPPSDRPARTYTRDPARTTDADDWGAADGGGEVTLSTRPDARAHARQRWAALRDRLSTVTPESVGRMLLALSVASLALGLAAASWPALAPFVVGVVIAYAVLPIANRLDRFMPRVLAALLAELVALGVLLLAVVAVVPPLVNGLVQVAGGLPTQAQVQTQLDDFEASLGNLQEPVRGIVLSVTTQAVANLQATLNAVIAGTGKFVADQILGVFGTLSFVLGLLVIPAWVLTLVSDERSIKRKLAGEIAPAIRPDVIALVRIVDRAFGTLLRVRVLLALVVGGLIWVGLELVQAAGIGVPRYQVTASVLLGGLQLIPELGYFLGFFPLLLVLAVGGPVPFAAIVVVYVVANRIASDLVETRVSRGVLDVHPGLLIPAIVVLSQFGVLWLLAAAPIVAILRDATRYLAGRLREPAAPAGVLPGEPVPPAAVVAPGAPVTVPSVYRPAVPPPFTATRAPRRGVAVAPTAGPVPERSTAS